MHAHAATAPPPGSQLQRRTAQRSAAQRAQRAGRRVPAWSRAAPGQWRCPRCAAACPPGGPAPCPALGRWGQDGARAGRVGGRIGWHGISWRAELIRHPWWPWRWQHQAASHARSAQPVTPNPCLTLARELAPTLSVLTTASYAADMGPPSTSAATAAACSTRGGFLDSGPARRCQLARQRSAHMGAVGRGGSRRLAASSAVVFKASLAELQGWPAGLGPARPSRTGKQPMSRDQCADESPRPCPRPSPSPASLPRPSRAPSRARLRGVQRGVLLLLPLAGVHKVGARNVGAVARVPDAGRRWAKGKGAEPSGRQADRQAGRRAEAGPPDRWPGGPNSAGLFTGLQPANGQAGVRARWLTWPPGTR